jgi:hypothetical protein
MLITSFGGSASTAKEALHARSQNAERKRRDSGPFCFPIGKQPKMVTVTIFGDSPARC